VDPRLDQASVVAVFAEAVRPVAGVVGFYAGGSLALGDFRPGISDLDLAAVVAAELDDQQRERLLALHEAVQRDEPTAAKLHCVYVPRHNLAQPCTPHLTWAHGELFHRPFTGIARAELLRDGITVYGPPPAELLPPVSLDALQQGRTLRGNDHGSVIIYPLPRRIRRGRGLVSTVGGQPRPRSAAS
jgi:Nucleotidyltransferase domain